MSTSIATLDASSVCSDIAEMEMPVSTSNAPEGSLSRMFEGITPAASTEAPKSTPKKAKAKKVAPKKATLEATPEVPAPTALEAAKAKKLPKTILDSGLTYSLLSRVRNAFNKNLWAEMEKGTEMLSMVDGRGTEQTISDIYVGIANDLGGAKYLASVRTSHVRRALREKGVAVK